MVIYNKEEVTFRIRELREERGLSQLEMGDELNKLIGRGGKLIKQGRGLSLHYVNGGQTVSQLENGTRCITQDFAFAYAEIFDVTLDYIYGRSDERNHEYSELKKISGLSDTAISALLEFKDEIIKMVKNTEI